jgi:hypothetical protein
VAGHFIYTLSQMPLNKLWLFPFYTI